MNVAGPEFEFDFLTHSLLFCGTKTIFVQTAKREAEMLREQVASLTAELAGAEAAAKANQEKQVCGCAHFAFMTMGWLDSKSRSRSRSRFRFRF